MTTLDTIGMAIVMFVALTTIAVVAGRNALVGVTVGTTVYAMVSGYTALGVTAVMLGVCALAVARRGGQR